MSGTALFIFRRDFRLDDNTALMYALEHFEEVVPCFIFTPEQLENNPYRSDHCLQFCIESLEDLDRQLAAHHTSLRLFYGKPEEIVARCIRELGVVAVIANRDYTPYSQKRDQAIQKACEEHRVTMHLFDDALLHPPEDTLKSDGTPYTVFTPFFRNACKLMVPYPVTNRRVNYFKGRISFCEKPDVYEKILPKRHSTIASHGGRSEALKLLQSLDKLQDYVTARDIPSLDKTTHLSPHLKFTTCSVREVYHAVLQSLGKQHELIRSLYWRDFFTTIAYFFPHVFGTAFRPQYDRAWWNRDEMAFKRWFSGTTGFPIVDAGMRQMNQTGFMHNRVRMVAASFLCKDLHIDWRWGERYFAQTLVDYDPAVNNGNWQWVASTGCDAQPYFRIFNPWSQQKRFDPAATYIKQWVPELVEISPKAIHEWYDAKHHTAHVHYPLPMVDHATEVVVAKRLGR